MYRIQTQIVLKVTAKNRNFSQNPKKCSKLKVPKLIIPFRIAQQQFQSYENIENGVDQKIASEDVESFSRGIKHLPKR